MTSVLDRSRDWLVKDSPQRGPFYRYGMLFVCLALLLFQVWSFLRFPDTSANRYSGLAIVVMLLLNHVAFAFRWPRRMTIILRIMALGWMIIGFYIIVHELYLTLAR